MQQVVKTWLPPHVTIGGRYRGIQGRRYVLAKAKKTSRRPRNEAQKATEKNLIPNDMRTPDELRRITTKGGKKSGALRRQQCNLRQAFSTIMAMKPKEKDRNEIADALQQMTANEEAQTSPAIQALKYLFPESTTMSECTQQIKAAAKTASGARRDVEQVFRKRSL